MPQVPKTADKVLLSTVTGEPFQPARIYYEVFDRKGLLNAFHKLRCMEHDPSNQRWVWLYTHEAHSLVFTRKRKDLPKEVHPIVIGAFRSREGDQILLDLRSFDRVVLALRFFHQRIPHE